MDQRVSVVGLLVLLTLGTQLTRRCLGESTPAVSVGASEEGGATSAALPRGIDLVAARNDRLDPRTELETEPQDPAEDQEAGVRILVVTEADEPLADAKVTLFYTDLSTRMQRTDARGRVSFRPEGSAIAETLLASREGRATVQRVLDAHDRDITVQLLPMEPWVAPVIDAMDGTPVPGATIELAWIGTLSRWRSTSGDDGRVQFESIPREAQLAARASAKGYTGRTWRMALPASPGAAPGGSPIELMPARSLTGRIVDSVTSEVIAVARVEARSSQGASNEWTNHEGRFAFEPGIPLDEPSFRVRVQARGYCAIEADFSQDTWNQGGDIRLPPTAQLTVRILEPDGRGSARAFLVVNRSSDKLDPETPDELVPWLDDGWRVAKTSLGEDRITGPDGDRIYRVHRVPFEEPVELFAVHRDFENVRTPSSRAGGPGSVQERELTLAPKPGPMETGRIRGTLRVLGVPTPGQVLWRSSIREKAVTTDEAGSFAIDGIDPGEVIFSAVPKSGPYRELGPYFQDDMPLADARPRVNIGAGESLELDLDLRFQVAPLAGTAVNRNGIPIAEVPVRVSSLEWNPGPASGVQDGTFARTLTDAQGAFELSVPLALAPYRLNFDHGIAGESVEVESGPRQDLAIVVDVDDVERRHPARVLVRLLTPSGPSLEHAPRLHAFDADSGDPRACAGVHERWEPFVFELPFGTHDLVVEPLFGLPVHFEDVVLDSTTGTHVLDVTLKPGYKLEARVAPGCAPIPEHVQVLLLEEDRWNRVLDPGASGGRNAPYPGLTPERARSVRFGEEQRFGTAGNLPPGRYRFKVFPPDITIEPEWIEMGSSDQRVEIRWE